MKNAVQILKSKANQAIHSIAPTESVFDAIKLMAERNIGALLVLRDGEIVGILTERDYARKVVLTGRSSKQTQVCDVMNSPVQYVRPNHTTDECMALMTQGFLRHLPVIEDGKLLGLISIGDLVKNIISEQQFIIEQLEHYIAGDRS